jgi:hypothetical protein
MKRAARRALVAAVVSKRSFTASNGDTTYPGFGTWHVYNVKRGQKR